MELVLVELVLVELVLVELLVGVVRSYHQQTNFFPSLQQEISGLLLKLYQNMKYFIVNSLI